MDQRTHEWFCARLGHFTGSEIGKLMISSKKKDELFGDGAISYIIEKMAERDLIDEIKEDEEVFNEYHYITSTSNKAMQFGTDNEPLARKLIIKELGEGFEEVGSIPHPSIKWFSSSPDGMSKDNSIALEIKCPSIDAVMRYRCFVKDGESLKKEKSLYYWQAMSHMAVTGAKACVFVVFNPFLKHPLYHFVVDRDEKAIQELETRVIKANEYIESLKQ